jgi:succinate dehydrogenase/fumarate reductase flavoprotein subunit
MKSELIHMDVFELRCFSVNTLVIGSGAAALNAAISLHSSGQHDLVIATSLWGGGTSNNAGSDKQTYYKLSLSGNQPDSVPEMAADLFGGKCMHGDIALCEAQESVRAFMNLVNLGVKFPHDRYGAWAGYRTDHDSRSRATSAGPYTSKRMFEALAGEVKRYKIKILDRHQVVSLLTDQYRTRVIGALAINMREKDPLKAMVLFNCENVILGTGGPAGIYKTSVYPISQSGSIGMAFKAGATGQNLTESQFGIASVKFRWNLSGSYQQAIPTYISTDNKGNDRREFLNQFFADYRSLTKAIFLKGYQWPFDPGKIEKQGSSLIDLLVYREITEKNRKVFLDYTSNPSFGAITDFSFDELDSEVYNYLRNSAALKETPLERLLSINFPAYDLYKEHGIDLSKEMLEIAVCAQHNNGGLKGDIWWESDLKHLFPVGEVNGTHGVSRPGGSALNSGQVGSLRAARHIFKKYNNPVCDTDIFLEQSKPQVEKELFLAKKWIAAGQQPGNRKYLQEIRKRMSEAGGIIRNLNRVADAVSEARKMLNDIPDMIGARSVRELAGTFLLMDHCLTHFVYLEAIKEYLAAGGRSRGSFLVTGGNIASVDLAGEDIAYAGQCNYDRAIENEILEISYCEGEIFSKLVKPREIPEQNLWFEKVWKDYLEDNSEGY